MSGQKGEGIGRVVQEGKSAPVINHQGLSLASQGVAGIEHYLVTRPGQKICEKGRVY